MENMEKISWQIWNKDGFGRDLLIGGLLFYVPVINLLLLGYYGIWVRKLVLKEGFDLPEWRDGRAILNELGRVIVPFLAWIILPLVLAGLLVWAMGGLLNFIHLGWFAATVAFLPLALLALLCPLALISSLLRLYKRNSLREALMVQEILQDTLRNLKPALFPTFQFFGIISLGWPLLGFAAFTATLPFLAQLILVMSRREDDLKSPEY